MPRNFLAVFMTSRRFLRLSAFLKVAMWLVPAWSIYFLVDNLVSSDVPTPENVRSFILSKPLHLIDQKRRSTEFDLILREIKSVESSARREILKGPAIKLWFYRLMWVERARFMETFLPQYLLRGIKTFLTLSDENQIRYIFELTDGLRRNNKFPPEINAYLMDQGYQPEALKKKIQEFWGREKLSSRYGRILTLAFDKMSADESMSSFEKAEAVFMSEFLIHLPEQISTEKIIAEKRSA